MAGSLPPSSRQDGMRRRAQASATLRPVATLPVKQMMSDCSMSAAPVRTVALDEGQHAGELGEARDRGHERRDEPRRHLTRLHDHRAAGHQRRDRIQRGQQERENSRG